MRPFLLYILMERDVWSHHFMWTADIREMISRGNIRTAQILTPKETGILEIACRIPDRIPSEKQSVVLMDVLAKAKSEARKTGTELFFIKLMGAASAG